MQLKDLLTRIKAQLVSNPNAKDQKRRELLRHESELGGRLFGVVKPGNSRDFFCLDENTWIWHESFKDAKGKNVMVTTRYDIYPDKIIKAQDGQPYRILDEVETLNLYSAIYAYWHLVLKNIYNKV